MSLHMLMYAIGGGSAGPSVTMADETVSNFRTITAPCHAKFRIGSDGNYYKSDNVGNYSASAGTWLTTGQNSSVWVERTMKSASPTLDQDGIGGSRIVCSLNRSFGYEHSINGEESGTVTLDFYDAASGGNLLDTADISLSASFDDGS